MNRITVELPGGLMTVLTDRDDAAVETFFDQLNMAKRQRGFLTLRTGSQPPTMINPDQVVRVKVDRQ